MKNIFFLWSLALWVFSLGTEMLPTRKPTPGREILQPSAHLLLSRERLLYVLSCWEQAVVHLLARLSPIFVLSCEDLARASHGGPSMVSLESEGQSLREVATDGLQIAHSRGADCFGTRHYPHELRANCSLLVWSARCRWQQEEHCSWTQWVLQKDRGDEERPSCLSSLEWEVQEAGRHYRNCRTLPNTSDFDLFKWLEPPPPSQCCNRLRRWNSRYLYYHAEKKYWTLGLGHTNEQREWYLRSAPTDCYSPLVAPWLDSQSTRYRPVIPHELDANGYPPVKGGARTKYKKVVPGCCNSGQLLLSQP